jgi:uncharacterized protein YbdZ (MbtH family)
VVYHGGKVEGGAMIISEKHWTELTPAQRQEDRAKQKTDWGWDDTELISLKSTIVKLLAPRLRRFAFFTISTPMGVKYEVWAAQCKLAADKLESDSAQDQTEAMQWIADNFHDLWS